MGLPLTHPVEDCVIPLFPYIEIWWYLYIYRYIFHHISIIFSMFKPCFYHFYLISLYLSRHRLMVPMAPCAPRRIFCFQNSSDWELRLAETGCERALFTICLRALCLRALPFVSRRRLEEKTHGTDGMSSGWATNMRRWMIVLWIVRWILTKLCDTWLKELQLTILEHKCCSRFRAEIPWSLLYLSLSLTYISLLGFASSWKNPKGVPSSMQAPTEARKHACQLHVNQMF